MSKPTPQISDLKADALRERFSLSRSYAFQLAKHEKVPSLELAVRIEEEFGVPAAAWLQPRKDAAA
jgi:transcriptional regulator with XRE-family HTH domain